MTNEFKIGLTVILAVITGYLGLRFMSDIPLFRDPLEVTTTFDRVDGLSVGNIVYMNGLKIGSVKGMDLTDDYRVRVVLGIDTDVRIPDDSVARLTASGLLDEKSIEIRRGTSGRMVSHGDSLSGAYVGTLMEDLGSRSAELSGSVAETIEELNLFLSQLNRTLDEESSRALGQTLRNLESTTAAASGVLTSKRGEIEEAIHSLNRVMSRLDSLSSDARTDSLLASLDRSARELESLGRGMDRSIGELNEILAKINQGEGTIGKLVNDSSLYENVDSLSVELKNVLRSLNENPGRFLRHMNLLEIF